MLKLRTFKEKGLRSTLPVYQNKKGIKKIETTNENSSMEDEIKINEEPNEKFNIVKKKKKSSKEKTEKENFEEYELDDAKTHNEILLKKKKKKKTLERKICDSGDGGDISPLKTDSQIPKENATDSFEAIKTISDELAERLSKKKKKKKRKHDNDQNDSDNEEENLKESKRKKHTDKNEENKFAETLSEKCSSSKEVKEDNGISSDASWFQRPSYYNPDLDYDFKNEKKEVLKSRYQDPTEDAHLHAKPRHHTISIAVPASILEETCLLQELRTYVIGQIARSACIYSVDEIIVYNDKGWTEDSYSNQNMEEYMGMMKMILEYQECPQYLRRDLFPKHYYMTKVGVLNALNAPHHLLAHQWCSYREGVVLRKWAGKFSCVDVGLKSDVEVDRKLEPGLRVTVRFPPETKAMRKMYGYIVSPDEPRTKGAMYWGYTVRTAYSLSEALQSDRFKGGYDLVVGTSDKGQDAREASFDTFKHALVVFGGVQGLESAFAADASLRSASPSSSPLFAHYLNVCPDQTSRTIRTEEAVLIALATLSPKLAASGTKTPHR